jgi:uncharacterized coiled-coil protein SlyX
MERVSHKMEGLIQRQKKLLEQSQAAVESRAARDKSQYLAAAGGFAAGVIVTAIGWLAASIVITGPAHMHANEKALAVQRGELEQLNDSIAQLHARVDSLAGSVSGLETGLTQVVKLAGSVTGSDAKPLSSSERPVAGSETSGTMAAPAGSEDGFQPTHMVTTRVNLRSAASVKAEPITVLAARTEVEYLSKSDGWYYVNTRLNGKGWCSSDYLSPLPSAQRNSSAR